MSALRKVIPPALILLALAGIWELYVDLGGADPLILPPPHAIASSLFDDRSLLLNNFVTTASEMLLGMVVAIGAGFAVAVAIHFSEVVRRALYPLVIASQTVPTPLFAPVLVLWLGFGLLPKLMVIGVVCFFPVVVTTLDALDSVDPDLLKLMRTFDATRWRTFVEVELPGAVPGLFTGAKIAAVVTPIAAWLAELTGASGTAPGLGNLFQLSESQLLIARAYATVIVLSAFAITTFAVLTVAERRLLPWTYQRNGELTR